MNSILKGQVGDSELNSTRTIQSIDYTNYVLENRKAKNADELFHIRKLEINNKKEEKVKLLRLSSWIILTLHPR